MAKQRNGVVPNGHFHKDWQRYIKTWFDQPGRKKRRREIRKRKALKVAPRPVAGLLRPIVRCQTVRYNHRQRLGRGFTLDEVRQAGISKKLAITIGISVDHRRKNRSLEGLQSNVKRLKEYKSRLVLFPINKKKPRPGDSSQAECDMATQSKAKNLFPLKRVVIRERPREIKKHEKRLQVYSVLRQARSEAKNVGKTKKPDSKTKKKKK